MPFLAREIGRSLPFLVPNNWVGSHSEQNLGQIDVAHVGGIV